MKRKAYSRGEREQMILDAMYRRIGDGLEPEMTSYQVAKALGLNSAQHVRNIMEEMCRKRMLDFRMVEHRPGVAKMIFRPWPLVQAETKEHRYLPLIRVNGKAV